MKKGNVEITKNTGSIAKGYRIEGSSSVWKGLYTEDDLKDLRDCIDEVLGEDCPHKKSALSKSTRWGSGEWTGKDSYDCDKDGARTKQGTCKCKCHQEKETEKKCCPCKGDYVSEFCRGECICHRRHETEKETPNKLPSERIDEITIEKIAVNLQDVLGGKNPIVQGAKIEAILEYLDETAKDLPTPFKK